MEAMFDKQDSQTDLSEDEIMELFSHHFVPMNQIRRAHDQMRDPLSRDLLRDLYETRRGRLIREAESLKEFTIAETLRSSKYDLKDIPQPQE